MKKMKSNTLVLNVGINENYNVIIIILIFISAQKRIAIGYTNFNELGYTFHCLHKQNKYQVHI